MRAKQSFTASGKYSHTGSFTTPTSTHPDASAACEEAVRGCQLSTCPTAVQGEGMLHDARNLLGAIGLYCDLLALPGVLKPEHSQYPEELRHLGARSGALIEALMRSLLMRGGSKELSPAANLGAGQSGVRTEDSMVQESTPSLAKPVSLRGIVERCAGLLRRVANGRKLEVELGPAADATVRVAEDAVERILVNLVRNAAAAMEAAGAPGDSESAIRITLGLLNSRVGGAKPWPFQRVRLSVEDTGCGMSASQVESLLSGTSRQTPDSSHGIGFRVVRELAAASEGDVQVVSAVGSGTRVQIEWPLAVTYRDLPGERVAQRMHASLPQPYCRDQPARPGANPSQAQMGASC